MDLCEHGNLGDSVIALSRCFVIVTCSLVIGTCHLLMRLAAYLLGGAAQWRRVLHAAVTSLPA